MYERRDGTSVKDGRMGRLIEFDERSRDFALEPSDRDKTADSVNHPVDALIEQGIEVADVGASLSHALGTRPVSADLSDRFAVELDAEAKGLDPWDAEGVGTSLLAGCKALLARGLIESYRWCFSVEDIIRALVNHGPVVVGTHWYEDMLVPRGSGKLSVSGVLVGGHTVLIRGYDAAKSLPGEPEEPMFRVRNSFGLFWGYNGDAWITVKDFEDFLLYEGEAVVLLGRKSVPQALMLQGGGASDEPAAPELATPDAAPGRDPFPLVADPTSEDLKPVTV